MKLTEINSIDDLIVSYQRIRDMKEGFVTNLFLNPFLVNIWTKHKLLYKTSLDKTDFIVRKDNGFMHLYFCSTSDNALGSDLKLFHTGSNEKYVIDIIGDHIKSNSLARNICSCGFISYATLQRMTMSNFNYKDFQVEDDNNLRVADKSDLEHISTLIGVYFDKYSEQFPQNEELDNWIDSGNILVYSYINSIIGFSIFDIKGYTSHLRYILVLPAHRGSGIGSRLIKRGIYCNPIVKSHNLWVNVQNNNAIAKYAHYGFVKDDLTDQIFINKNIKNGT